MVCTGEHPFYINNKGWAKARDLIENDEVIHYNEEVSRINKIYKEVLDTLEDTYNFEVEDFHMVLKSIFISIGGNYFINGRG
ncbi:MAG: hypothetical protein J1F31_00900 [Erysipelotrichales bacterium]|nr:hypothetical protein [Erysipelotrichales bacterium]